MFFLALLLGFVFGFFGSLPVAGPISFIVLARGLHGRFRSGLLLAGGAALAEGCYAFFAFWGMSAVLALHPLVSAGARGLGALILLALGGYFLRHHAVPPPQEFDKEHGDKRSFFLGFTITALNPTLIATWTAAIAVLHSTEVVPVSSGLAAPFALGVTVGIFTWFALLLTLLGRYRTLLRPAGLARLMIILACCLMVLGLWLAVATVRPFL